MSRPYTPRQFYYTIKHHTFFHFSLYQTLDRIICILQVILTGQSISALYKLNIKH